MNAIADDDAGKAGSDEATLPASSATVVKAIEQNAAMPEDQNAYNQKYENLATRHEATVTRLNEIAGEKRYRKTLRDTLRRFASTLENSPSPATEFSTEAWTALVEKVTVFGKNEIRFTLRNGTEMTI